jgi:hypothetical protein
VSAATAVAATASNSAEPATDPAPGRAARYPRALLLARIYECLPVLCPQR